MIVFFPNLRIRFQSFSTRWILKKPMTGWIGNFCVHASHNGVRGKMEMDLCVSSTNFSILVNGCPKDFFSTKRGLRHRDASSPFLFVIIGEALSRMVTTLEGTCISKFSVGFLVAPF